MLLSSAVQHWLRLIIWPDITGHWRSHQVKTRQGLLVLSHLTYFPSLAAGISRRGKWVGLFSVGCRELTEPSSGTDTTLQQQQCASVELKRAENTDQSAAAWNQTEHFHWRSKQTDSNALNTSLASFTTNSLCVCIQLFVHLVNLQKSYRLWSFLLFIKKSTCCFRVTSELLLEKLDLQQ